MQCFQGFFLCQFFANLRKISKFLMERRRGRRMWSKYIFYNDCQAFRFYMGEVCVFSIHNSFKVRKDMGQSPTEEIVLGKAENFDVCKCDFRNFKLILKLSFLMMKIIAVIYSFCRGTQAHNFTSFLTDLQSSFIHSSENCWHDGTFCVGPFSWYNKIRLSI